jgi:desulfoferrodoxin-like iron-binding protein
MGQEGELYRCEICGQEVRVTLAGPGRLYCCGEPMTLVRPDEDAAPDER